MFSDLVSQRPKNDTYEKNPPRVSPAHYLSPLHTKQILLTAYCCPLHTTETQLSTTYIQPTTCYLQPTTDYLPHTTYLRPTFYHLLSATTSYTRTTLSKVSTPAGSACFSTWRISIKRTTPVCFAWHTSQVHPIIFNTPLSAPCHLLQPTHG